MSKVTSNIKKETHRIALSHVRSIIRGSVRKLIKSSNQKVYKFAKLCGYRSNVIIFIIAEHASSFYRFVSYKKALSLSKK